MPPPPVPRGSRHEDGVLSLEFALALPLLVLAVVAALQGLGLGRDVLVAQDAARAGARAAATASGTAPVAAAVAEAVGGRDVAWHVAPESRGEGDLATVVVTLSSRVGPVTLDVRADASARVEPGVAP